MFRPGGLGGLNSRGLPGLGQTGGRAMLLALKQKTCEKAEEDVGRHYRELEIMAATRAAQVEALINGLVFEVAQRKQALELMRRSEEQYRLLFETNPFPMWVISTETHSFLAVNEAAVCRYGFSRQEFLAMTAKDVGLGEDDASFLNNLPGFTSAGVRKHRKKDGTAIEVEVSTQGIMWAGRTARLVLAHDVTEHQQAERALLEAEAKYRSIFENAIEGIFRTTADGRFLAANPALAEIYGYGSPEEFVRCPAEIGEKLGLDAGARDKFKYLLHVSDVVKGFETRVSHNEGTPIWVSINAHAVRDAGGKFLHYEGTVQDITKRKEAERALCLLSGRLLILQDEERRHIARELHDSMAQNLAALAMDLTRVKESAGKLDRKSREALAESLELADQCGREIRTLCYLLHPPLLDEHGLAAALRWYVDGFTQRSGIRVSLHVPALLGRLPREIETALFRIVQESLTNVHRHSGSPWAAIKVFLDSSRVGLEVKDAGKGISPWEHGKLVDGVMGLGVGIAGMRERVKQLGGELRVRSTTGGGVIVKAILPCPGGGDNGNPHSGRRRS